MLLSKMTNSEPGSVAAALASAIDHARPRGKRERLIAAAAQMIYQQGLEKTTLADIAAAAEVPLGNVYAVLLEIFTDSGIGTMVMGDEK
jgi:hypothetical protein